MRHIQREIDSGAYSNNIPRPAENSNFYEDDPNIRYLMMRYLPASMQEWADRELSRFGELVAGPVDERASYTDDEGRPRLKRYNRRGEEISEIITNDGYKQTVKDVYESGIVGYLYHEIPELKHKAPYAYSYLQGYLLSQSEPGFYCPVTLTMSAAYLIDRYGSEEQKETYLKGLASLDYKTLYEGATWLTERQGGSDVGANLTVAEPDPKRRGVYRLTGEKFFASNAGAMVATVLARVNPDKPGTKGLGLFLVPWVKPDGTRNTVYVRRLKDKLGVNAVPSAEVILEEAEGYLIGDPDKGFKYMADALNISRICNAIASVGIMRRAFYEAWHYASQRKAFGQAISRYPMVRETLLDMLMELEVNTGACFEMIRYFDRVVTTGDATRDEKVMARLLVPLLKYRTGEEAVAAAHKSIETHGGNGYIEEYVTPRLLRDAQVLTVWEGTSNILALDVIRVFRKEKGHDVFIRVMEQEINELNHPLSQAFIPVLNNAVAEIRETIQFLFQQKEDVITWHMKRFADYMIDVFQLIQILKEAEDQVTRDGNARKFVVARLYKKKHFECFQDRGLKDARPVELDYFEKLMEYGHIPVETLIHDGRFSADSGRTVV
ncbi:MAG: acyl-CoA dehydrogenase family protein [Bacillaceae bacterium]|nr:acyl-CoA dehydrogenase family protein [Bacillaceae bacterium]